MMSLLLDGMVTESVPCAKVLPGELRAGDVFRWSGRFASDPFTTQCVTVVEVGPSVYPDRNPAQGGIPEPDGPFGGRLRARARMRSRHQTRVNFSEYDEQVFVIDQDGYVWMFDVDDVIEVISLSASLDGVS